MCSLLLTSNYKKKYHKNLHVAGGGITDQVETSRIKEVTTLEVLVIPISLA